MPAGVVLVGRTGRRMECCALFSRFCSADISGLTNDDCRCASTMPCSMNYTSTPEYYILRFKPRVAGRLFYPINWHKL